MTQVLPVALELSSSGNTKPLGRSSFGFNFGHDVLLPFHDKVKRHTALKI
jgi:hypothetical protein